MIEQVDWNFCCKVADRMESDRQEGITALSNGAILLGGMLNYIELATSRTRRQTGCCRGLRLCFQDCSQALQAWFQAWHRGPSYHFSVRECPRPDPCPIRAVSWGRTRAMR